MALDTTLAPIPAPRPPITIPALQHVVMLKRFGGADALEVVESPVAEPGVGEVLVKELAASVQFTDVILRKGRYPDLRTKPPLVLGYDVVGEVVKVGVGVSSPLVGERVAALTVTGSYAQYRTLRADEVAVVDAALDPAEVTSLVLSWMTAYQLLHRDADVQRGQHLLVIGAAGAVGQALIILGHLAGCSVWGAARARHESVIGSLGATFVDHERADFAAVRPMGFDAVFDGIGEHGFSRSWRAVGQGGHLSAYGFSEAVARNSATAKLGISMAKLWLWNFISSRGRSTSFFSITASRKKQPEWFRNDLRALLRMLARGDIKPAVAERIALDAVAEAHTRLERGGLEGKIVLTPNG